MNGPNVSSAEFLSPSNVGDLNYRVVATGDFDRDGHEDIVFQHSNGTLAIWFMNRTTMSRAAFFNPSNPGDRNWRVVGTADINGDGKTDLVFQHNDGTLAVWLMDGINLVSASLIDPKNPGPGWKVRGVIDLNADGKADLVFQHDDGTLACWTMDGTKMIAAQLLTPSHPGDKSWHIAGTGHFIVEPAKSSQVGLLFQRSDRTVAVWAMNGITLSSATIANHSNPGGTWLLVAPK